MIFTMFPYLGGNQVYGQSNVVTAFEQLEQKVYSFEGTPTLEEVTKEFPKEVEVYFEGESAPRMVPVTWEAVGGYDRYDYYAFTFVPKFEEGLQFADGLIEQSGLPQILLLRKESSMDAPVEEDVSLDAEDQALLSMVAYGDSALEQEIYDFLTEKAGLNMAASCGVIANLYKESALLSNNLENSKQAKLGSDSEYTKKVNGKKEYTRADFVGDHAGYGLCQWTSAGRKGKLYDYALDYCKKKGIKFNIANRTMQLEFFLKELQESYVQTWETLKAVPNSEIGAYMAAFTMCLNFESPQDTVNESDRRGKIALSGGENLALTMFWESASKKKSNFSGISYLGICGYRYPTKIAGGMVCVGDVVSNKGIMTIEASIKDAQDKEVCKYKVDYSKKKTKPTYYSLSSTKDAKDRTVNSQMTFTSLASSATAGKKYYTYNLTVTDTAGKVASFSKKFSTSTAYKANEVAYGSEFFCPSTLGGKNLTYPGTIKKGKNFKASGTVKSNYAIDYVSIGVKDANGTILMKVTDKPATKTYDVAELSKTLDLASLKGGQYQYYVYAKDSQKALYLLKKTFYINSKEAVDTKLPEELPTTKDFDLEGKIKSDCNITKINARVLNANGKKVMSKVVTLDKKTYSLTKLNSAFNFGSLPKGKYTLKVTATDLVSSKCLIDQSFKVYTKSSLKMSNYTYPTKLKRKQGFSVLGSVKSNYNLKSVRIRIYNDDGNQIDVEKVFKSKIKTYNIKYLDKKITFGQLKKGTYYYKVSAKDSKVTRTLLKKKFTVK